MNKALRDTDRDEAIQNVLLVADEWPSMTSPVLETEEMNDVILNFDR